MGKSLKEWYNVDNEQKFTNSSAWMELGQNHYLLGTSGDIIPWYCWHQQLYEKIVQPNSACTSAYSKQNMKFKRKNRNITIWYFSSEAISKLVSSPTHSAQKENL